MKVFDIFSILKGNSCRENSNAVNNTTPVLPLIVSHKHKVGLSETIKKRRAASICNISRKVCLKIMYF